MIKKYYKLILVGLLLGAIFTIVFLKDSKTLNTLPGYNTNTGTKGNTPGEGTENPANTPLYLVGTNPQNDMVMDSGFIKFEFSKSVNASDFQLQIEPNIAMKKEVKPNNPNILWVSPIKIWEENVRYKITLTNKNLEKSIVYYTTFMVVKPPVEIIEYTHTR